MYVIFIVSNIYIFLGNPKANPNATSDPYKTLFVYKLDPKIDEKKLKKEFEQYGEIKKIRVIRDFTGKSRGYAFIEYSHMSDFKNVYRRVTKKKIGNSYAYIDCEKGRVEKNWKPRRFGGGEGNSREMPTWLKIQLEEIRKKYPNLSEEKGEIVSDREEYKNSPNNSIDGLNKKRKRSKSESEETIKEYSSHNHRNNRSSHRHSRSKRRRSKSRSRSKKKQKKEYEVGEII